MTQAVDHFAKKGLRTLCFARRDLSPGVFSDWFTRYKLEKCTASEDQQDNLDMLAEEIERDLVYIGLSALEDKLQSGVEKALQGFTQAGIKV